MFHFSGVGPQYGKRATMIFACGDQTFFKVDESILTGAMLPKINVVADKTTIRKFFYFNAIAVNRVKIKFILIVFSSHSTNTNVLQLPIDQSP